jgi:hypothetical protein
MKRKRINQNNTSKRKRGERDKIYILFSLQLLKSEGVFIEGGESMLQIAILREGMFGSFAIKSQCKGL